MTDDLYNAAIVAAAKAGTGAGRLPAPTHAATCDSPLCGDRITLELDLAGDRLTAVGHVTRGCLLTRAAASLLAETLAGSGRVDGAAAADAIRAVLAGEAPPSGWERLAMLAPVGRIASRHDCVLLPFRALDEALAQGPELAEAPDQAGPVQR